MVFKVVFENFQTVFKTIVKFFNLLEKHHFKLVFKTATEHVNG
jgi:hypothetical protein